jgi:hypothetical protein
MTTTDTNNLDLAVPSPVPERRDTPGDVFANIGAFKADLKDAGLDGAMELLSTVQVRKPHPKSSSGLTPVGHDHDGRSARKQG